MVVSRCRGGPNMVRRHRSKHRGHYDIFRVMQNQQLCRSTYYRVNVAKGLPSTSVKPASNLSASAAKRLKFQRYEAFARWSHSKQKRHPRRERLIGICLAG